MSQTAKVLLLYAHPESQDSVANRVLLRPASQLSNVTVHDLYAHYPDFFIDIPREQALLREHDVIVFQHPLYTYSCPALLKEWLDRVLSRDQIAQHPSVVFASRVRDANRLGRGVNDRLAEDIRQRANRHLSARHAAVGYDASVIALEQRLDLEHGAYERGCTADSPAPAEKL